MYLLGTSHATRTWDATALYDQDGVVYVRGKVSYDPNQVIIKGFQERGLYWIRPPDDMFENVGNNRVDSMWESNR